MGHPILDRNEFAIRAIETIHLCKPFAKTPSMKALDWDAHFIIARISAGDVTGMGYAWDLRPDRARSIRTIIKDMTPDLIGRDSAFVRELWQVGWTTLRHMGQHHGVGLAALSAIDMALWDLLGRRLFMPLHQIWGANAKDLPVYLTGGIGNTSPEQLADEGEIHLRAGYKAMKVQVGNPDWRHDANRIAKLRERVGDTFEIFVDSHMQYDRRTAFLAGRAFFDLGVSWFEDPLPPDDLEGYAWLRDTTQVPIVHGENVYTRSGVLDVLRAKAADYMMLDSMHCGGPTEMLASAAIAAAYHVPVSTHAFHAIAPQVMMACDNANYIEYQDAICLFEGESKPVDGMISPSNRPGFGLELPKETEDKYSLDE